LKAGLHCWNEDNEATNETPGYLQMKGKLTSIAGLVEVATFALTILALGNAATWGAEGEELWSHLLRDEGLRTGLYVCVGDVSARQAAAISQKGRNLVHCLLPNEKKLVAFRSDLRRLNSRRVTGDVFAGAGLPYVVNLVNVLAIDNFAAFERAGGDLQEVLRVVAPRGQVLIGHPSAGLEAQLKKAGVQHVERFPKLLSFARPWPAGMDEWTHPQHDAGRSSTSNDRFADVPKGVRWITGNLWPNRSTFSSPSPVFISAGGRNFYWVASGNKRKITTKLACRDAFNGLLLWEKNIAARPDSRGIVATGDSVYVYEPRKQLHQFEAATGNELAGIPGPPSTTNLLYADGHLILFDSGSQVAVFDEKTHQQLWRHEFIGDRDYWLSTDRVVASDGKVFIACKATTEGPWQITCRDLKTGEVQWKAAADSLDTDGALTDRLSIVCAAGGYVLAANGSRRLKFDEKYGQKGRAVNYVFSVRNGRLLSKFVFEPTGHGGFATNVFFLDGLVWSKTRDAWVGWDPKTGQERRRTKVPAITRCYPDHVAGDKIMTGKMHFVDIRTGEQSVFSAARSACRTGFFPANGMTYTLPTRCLCFRMLRGFLGLSPASALGSVTPVNPLVKGPAHGAKAGTTTDTDWNTYRADGARGAVAKVAIPAKLKTKWETDLKERISSPTVANGTVFISLLDSALVVAIGAQDGKEKWSFATGGRVDTPPTYHGGLLLFGCADGWVYGLNAKEGRLVWRFRAAPAARRIVVREQLESVWPVHGSVLVNDGIAFFAAGRHSYTDDGIFFYAVDAETGQLVWRARKKADEGYSHCAIPVTDGKTVYFGGRFQFDAKTGRSQPKGTGMALFAPMGMTTDNTSFAFRGGTDNRRGQWLYADKRSGQFLNSQLSYRSGNVTGKGAAGSLLAFAGENVFGFYQDPAQPHSQLFARDGDRRWSVQVPPWSALRLKALLASADKLFVAGAEVRPGEGAAGKVLVFAATNGRKEAEIDLASAPGWDGMAAADGRLYVVGADGILSCLQGE
jgi:outer membrane protein assembly factor BamB